jgi:hypothetical protein
MIAQSLPTVMVHCRTVKAALSLWGLVLMQIGTPAART